MRSNLEQRLIFAIFHKRLIRGPFTHLNLPIPIRINHRHKGQIMLVLKKIKYTPFKDVVANLVRSVPRVPVNSLKVGDLFLHIDANTGEYQVSELCLSSNPNEKVNAQLVYDEARGAQIFTSHTLNIQLVWLIPELVKRNLKELQAGLENYSQSDAQVLLNIRELLDTLDWEYSIGMDTATADAFIIYREDAAPANAPGKNIPLSVLADPQLLRETLRFLQKTFSEKVQAQMGN